MVSIVNKSLYAIAFVLQLFTIVQSALLPSFITPCSISDPDLNNCIGDVAQLALKNFTRGIPELAVPALDPVKLGKISVVGNGLKIVLENSTMTGLGDGKVSNFKLNMNKNTLNLDITSNISLVGKYNINGQILILPVVGNGDYTVLLKNAKISIKWKFDITETPDGDSYWQMKLVKRTYKMERAHFNLENLFGGNKLIGDTTLAFLNSNWELIMRDIAPPAVDQIMDVCLEAINKFYSKLSKNELLLP